MHKKKHSNFLPDLRPLVVMPKKTHCGTPYGKIHDQVVCLYMTSMNTFQVPRNTGVRGRLVQFSLTTQ